MGWIYYNHAMVSDVPPHQKSDITAVENASIWKMRGGGYSLFAKWVSDFDCQEQTNWWYIIKDNAYDIQSLKAKRRYEITKARKNFKVEIIDPVEYCEEMFDVQTSAYAVYPKKYRPCSNLRDFKAEAAKLDGVVFAAFSLMDSPSEKGIMCGYAYVKPEERRLNFIFQKTRPEYEKYGVNAALVDAVLLHFNEDIKDGKKYISDGQRAVNHETAFQDYLEKYFGFRKAYCRLHIVYRPSIKWAIPILFSMRKILQMLDKISVIHMINAVMKMEEINRGK